MMPIPLKITRFPIDERLNRALTTVFYSAILLLLCGLLYILKPEMTVFELVGYTCTVLILAGVTSILYDLWKLRN